MKVVAVASRWPTESYYLHREFFASLKRFGHEPLILGSKSGEYQGLGSKPKLLKRAIESGLIRDERMIFCDAFDVVFDHPPEDISRHARNIYGDGIVWNAELNCFPDSSLADLHPDCTTSYRYLNSGFAVGNTADFLKMLKWMKADDIPSDYRDENGKMVEPNDQDYVMRALLFSGLSMKLDHQAIICQTMCGTTLENFDLSGELVRNWETGACPMAFHWNGPAKTNGTADAILRKIGLR